MSIFVGCTIGPVFETIGLAQKPLEIWMASYMYSRVAQIIIQELNKNEKIEIISPHEEMKGNRGDMFQGVKGAGTFSDHIIFRADMSKEEANELLKEAKEKMYEEVSKEIASTINQKPKEVVKNYLKKKIYVLDVEKEPQNEEENFFPVKELVEELEIQDSFPPFLAKEKADDYLLQFINHANLKKSNWVKENQALNSDENNENEKLKIDSFKDIANRANKSNLLLNDYLAIIYSDGDSMGKLNAKFAEDKNQKSYFKLSEFITERAKANIKYVRGYGAMPIYFGGDDMFFIAPIYGENPEDKEKQISVFQLVENLSKNFDDAWEKAGISNEGIVPSLSFGIAISHYKYPFKHMREECQNALFGTAKEQKWANSREKKAIAIELRKHSGQKSSLILCGHEFEKNKISAYSAAVKYINDVVPKEEKKKKDEYALSRSMHWKVMEQYPLIESLLNLSGTKTDDMNKLSDENQKKRLKAWFGANSNLTDKEGTNDFDLVIDAMCEIVKSIGFTNANAERIKNTIDGLFRLAEFMCTKKIKGPEE